MISKYSLSRFGELASDAAAPCLNSFGDAEKALVIKGGQFPAARRSLDPEWNDRVGLRRWIESNSVIMNENVGLDNKVCS